MGRNTKTPYWFIEIPMHAGLRARLQASFTLTKDGYLRWAAGRTRFVCGRKTDPTQVEGRFDQLRKRIEGESMEAARVNVEGITLRVAAGRFYEYLDHRVKTGQPRPMSAVTKADYIKTLTKFGKCVGADRLIVEIAIDDFTKYAKLLATYAPTTIARSVAYIKRFFAWCVEDGILDAQPRYGSFFQRPTQQARRDVRMSKAKSYSPAEIQSLWKAADETEKLWIALGLNGAFDNSDVANFVDTLIDYDAGTIDYSRRKTGKVRRVIPMRPELMKRLKAYRRPAVSGDTFFVTPNGNALIRMKETRPGVSTPIDGLSQRWRRLMVRAGLRQKPKVISSTGRKAARRRSVRFAGDADGRGFRSLRTTFPNLAPPGFKEEVEIIMGHRNDSVLVENYLEHVGIKRLRELVDHVWAAAFTSTPRPDANAPTADTSEPVAASAGKS